MVVTGTVMTPPSGDYIGSGKLCGYVVLGHFEILVKILFQENIKLCKRFG